MPALTEFVRQNPKLIAYSAAVIPLLVLAFVRPELGLQWFQRVERAIAPLAERRRACVALFGVAGLLASSVAGFVAGVPVPRGHDEFSYALAGDTFAAGRLTNPPHPMGSHFESFHIIQQPTYMSKYPPGNGLLLALGQWLGGSQALGLWIGAGLLCATMLWMLQAWFPPVWALFGGIVAALQFGIYSYWTQTYWGGALACAGGALVLGSMRRIMREARPLDAVLMAAGLGLLANTRPFEGLGVSIPVAIALGIWAFRQRRLPIRALALRTVLPVLVVLGAIGCWMTYYNYRVAGNPLLHPYQVYAAKYDSMSAIGRTLEPGRTYRNSAMQTYYGGWVKAYEHRRTGLSRLYQEVQYRGKILWSFYVGPVLTLPLLLSLRRLRSKWIATAWAMLLFFLLFMAAATWLAAHYAAPGTALFVVVIVAGMEVLNGWKWRGRPAGAFLVRAIPAALVLILFSRVAQPRIFPRVQWIDHRMRIQQELENTGSRHLIFVRYSSDHSVSREWVYNRADIDSSKVVWAHDLGPEQNRTLLTFMNGRKSWLLEADAKRPRLKPYPAASRRNGSWPPPDVNENGEQSGRTGGMSKIPVTGDREQNMGTLRALNRNQSGARPDYGNSQDQETASVR